MFSLRIPLARIPTLAARGRLYSSLSEAPALNTKAVDEWISSPQRLVLTDTLHPERLEDLYITLPTRDGIRKPYHSPQKSGKLGYGHHIAFFHPRTPESLLRQDGTDGDLGPPEPYTRRMWVGGDITWDHNNPLLIGEKVISTSHVSSAEKKGFDRGTPMLFVNQTIEFAMVGKASPSVVEQRTHVYMPETNIIKPPREVQDIPAKIDFTFQYTPSLTTLFRFSALMFNAHHIHLDKDYTVKYDGYPERLVHGPLTALMLLEAVVYQNPGAQITNFTYRARNPLLVGRVNTICGHWQDDSSVKVWCVDSEGVVGMTGLVTLGK